MFIKGHIAQHQKRSVKVTFPSHLQYLYGSLKLKSNYLGFELQGICLILFYHYGLSPSILEVNQTNEVAI